ncbi:hypothetical protein [Desulfosediminicola ganghwensis]|uniref:hypothetical protein n=1 Tax=Desulfosediminicola ganghwensis TaxID=2569540 RepID=UPI0010ACAA69|nr:hypothetical protein [Desulfosediminicola ganghwensis]
MKRTQSLWWLPVHLLLDFSLVGQAVSAEPAQKDLSASVKVNQAGYLVDGKGYDIVYPAQAGLLEIEDLGRGRIVAQLKAVQPNEPLRLPELDTGWFCLMGEDQVSVPIRATDDVLTSPLQLTTAEQQLAWLRPWNTPPLVPIQPRRAVRPGMITRVDSGK